MTKWDGFNLLAFDTESTGVNPLEARIVQLALVELRPGHRPVATTYLVDPGIDIPEGAAAVHGFTRERAAAEATHTPETMLFEATGRIARWLGQGFPVIAFNASYDFTLLEAENLRNNVDTLVSRLGVGRVSPVLDPMVLDRYADTYRKGGRKLTDVCQHYSVAHTGAHGAAADALAAARLFPKVMAKHARKFPGQSLGGLHQGQVGWRRAQMESLRDYHVKVGKADGDYDGGWPLLDGLQKLHVAGVS